MLEAVQHNLCQLCLIKVPRHDEGSVRVFAVMFVNGVMQRAQSSAYIRVWWDINGNNEFKRLLFLMFLFILYSTLVQCGSFKVLNK